ncbi:MAG TPA: hypothetical protein PKX41_05435 [Anaerolineaceae bacterium]|nr:hypothetical protein [Anaerolineaceae bacterium]
MKQFWVEGLFISAKSARRFKKTGSLKPGDIEPFSRSYWAENPQEALKAATLDLGDGEWQEKPVVTQVSEEMKMRAIGAPELPGLNQPVKERKKG